MTSEQKDKLIEEMERLLSDFADDNKNVVSKQQYKGMKKALRILGYKVKTDDDMERVIITEIEWLFYWIGVILCRLKYITKREK